MRSLLVFIWGQRGSNPWPLACEANAHPSWAMTPLCITFFIVFHYITLHLKYKKLSFISGLNWIYFMIELYFYFVIELCFYFMIELYFYFVIELCIYFTVVVYSISWLLYTSIHNRFNEDDTGKWVIMLINMHYLLSLY